MAGHCTSTSLLEGYHYVIMADFVGRQFDVFRARNTAQVDWPELPDYLKGCGLSKMYPIGMFICCFDSSTQTLVSVKCGAVFCSFSRRYLQWSLYGGSK